jgi:hypothetical protein
MQSVQATRSGDFCPAFSGGKKITQFQQAQLWAVLSEEPGCPTNRVIEKMAEHDVPLPIGVRHINRLRAHWGLSRGKGRPRGAQPESGSEAGGALVKLMPHLSYVGVHLFAAWLEDQELWGQVVTLLECRIAEYGEAHPDADFALLHHRSATLLGRFQALFYAPLFGIAKLTEYDVKEHPLMTLVGSRYQSSTLNQFLGQLERIDAGEALLPALIPQESSQVVYVDGHMIAFWTTRSLHKGKITMIGRIMAGSQAVIAHNQEGQAVCVAYHPPDIRLPHMIVEYCRQIMTVTGAEVFVIDREVNSVDMARCFEEAGLGLLSMLDKNEYTGLKSWEVRRLGELDDGSVLYEGVWATPRPDDPRQFVVVDTTDRVLVYWGTSKVTEVVAPRDWPAVYRQRTAIQEYRFKEMKAHGALDVNYGTKVILGPDRHQQRARAHLDEARQHAQHKLEKKTDHLNQQREKVAESQSQGHTKRLDQRQRRLQLLHQEVAQATKKTDQLQQRLDALGEPKQRADRDVRKQLIMTIRTLLLENALLGFLAAICAMMKESMSLECLVKLVFDRSGGCLETSTELMYWINTAGLSATYQKLLGHVVEGISAMNLTHRGKPIRVRLREAPT